MNNFLHIYLYVLYYAQMFVYIISQEITLHYSVLYFKIVTWHWAFYYRAINDRFLKNWLDILEINANRYI